MTDRAELLFSEIFRICEEAQASSTLSSPSDADPSQKSIDFYEEDFRKYISFSNSIFSGNVITLSYEPKLNCSLSRDRYQNIWDEQKDKLLLKLVINCKNDWKLVCKGINRALQRYIRPEFLKKRYKSLKQGILLKKSCKFTRAEDEKLIEGVKKYGLNWVKISYEIGLRSPASLKNRFYYLTFEAIQAK